MHYILFMIFSLGLGFSIGVNYEKKKLQKKLEYNNKIAKKAEDYLQDDRLN